MSKPSPIIIEGEDLSLRSNSSLILSDHTLLRFINVISKMEHIVDAVLPDGISIRVEISIR